MKLDFLNARGPHQVACRAACGPRAVYCPVQLFLHLITLMMSYFLLFIFVIKRSTIEGIEKALYLVKNQNKGDSILKKNLVERRFTPTYFFFFFFFLYSWCFS